MIEAQVKNFKYKKFVCFYSQFLNWKVQENFFQGWRTKQEDIIFVEEWLFILLKNRNI